MLQEELEDLGQAGLVPDVERINAAGKHLLGLINDWRSMSDIPSMLMTWITSWTKRFPSTRTLGFDWTTVWGMSKPLVRSRGGLSLEGDLAHACAHEQHVEPAATHVCFARRNTLRTSRSSVRLSRDVPSAPAGHD